jgi:hypothetical protein
VGCSRSEKHTRSLGPTEVLIQDSPSIDLCGNAIAMVLTQSCKLSFWTVPDLLTPDICLSFIVDSFEVSAPPRTWRLLTFLTKRDKFNIARFELHQLIGNPTLSGVPLLVVRLCCLLAPKMLITYFQLGNKNDLDGHATVKELIRELCVLSHPTGKQLNGHFLLQATR